VQEGDVIRIDDRLTGFDLNKKGRPYCVVRVVGEPWTEIFVVPRTTDRTAGAVQTPASAVPTLNEVGWFLFRAYRVVRADLANIEPVGRLKDPWRTQVMEQANTAEFEVD
jgi:hypothetical protein